MIDSISNGPATNFLRVLNTLSLEGTKIPFSFKSFLISCWKIKSITFLYKDEQKQIFTQPKDKRRKGSRNGDLTYRKIIIGWHIKFLESSTFIKFMFVCVCVCVCLYLYEIKSHEKYLRCKGSCKYQCTRIQS